MAKRRRLILTAEQRRELAAHRDHDPRPYVRERCAALLKVAEGGSVYAVARHGLPRPRDPDTVYGWLDLYQAGGLAGLIKHRPGGDRRGGPPEHEGSATTPEVLDPRRDPSRESSDIILSMTFDWHKGHRLPTRNAASCRRGDRRDLAFALPILPRRPRGSRWFAGPRPGGGPEVTGGERVPKTRCPIR